MERKFDLGKQKKHEAEYTNYIILDPICTTFEPEEASKQYEKFMESRSYNVNYDRPSNVNIDFDNCPDAAPQPRWFKEMEVCVCLC